jgi:hypothetical protein
MDTQSFKIRLFVLLATGLTIAAGALILVLLMRKPEASQRYNAIVMALPPIAAAAYIFLFLCLSDKGAVTRHPGWFPDIVSFAGKSLGDILWNSLPAGFAFLFFALLAVPVAILLKKLFC